MSIPAILICQPGVSDLRIAALTLLDRLVVAVARAGCAPIRVVGDGPLPRLKQASALGIPVQTVDHFPDFDSPALVATANVLVQPADLRRVLAARGRLVTRQGEPLPVGVLPMHAHRGGAGVPPAAAGGSLAKNSGLPVFKGGTPELAGGTPAPLPCAGAQSVPGGSTVESVDDPLAALAGRPAVAAQGVAIRVSDAESARAAERALWASLTSEADGLVDRCFNRPMGRFLSKLLIRTAATPNQVSLLATVVGLVSAACFSLGTATAFLIGALLLQLSAIIDCVDGEIARVLFKESRLGRWIDLGGDQVVHVAVFACIGIGLARAGSSAPVLALALSAAAGVLISLAVVLRGLLLPEAQRTSRFRKLIDATTNRDFSVILLALVLAGRLDWFLWLAGVGVHLFWPVALAVQFQGNHATPAVADKPHENRP